MSTVATAPLLSGRQIGKRFGGEVALADVDFELLPGEVHGLVGSNGAGKSTLMKILAGALPDHEGTLAIDGREVRLSSPQAALAHGIAMVYQELSGIGCLTVAENLFLGRQPVARAGRVDWRAMRSKAKAYLAELGLEIDVNRQLDRCPLVVRQMVEIARGLHSGARILILDEPTSALSPPEARRLFELVRQLKERGVAVVFITHFIEDILEICDRVTILKDGRRLETRPAAELDKRYIVHRMLGHEMAVEEVGYEASVTLPPPSRETPRLVARELSSAGAFQEIDLEVSPGECLGLYGFVGAGHQELAEALAGARSLDAGGIEVDGSPLPADRPRTAIHRGVLFVAGDRGRALHLGAEIYKNVTLAHLAKAVGPLLTRKAEERLVRPLLEQVGCRPPQPRLATGNLSGGNQQKVVVARWLLGPIRVLVLEEPTRGMDVGAKEDIMRLVAKLKSEGAAIILASIEPELLLAHSDRILVMRRGRVTHAFSDTELDKATLVRYA